ncbi:MAG: serine/threonine protein kinase, partial [Planctomycetales bacterium]|nr:serine/threonine protein kinase [Planctomycetales bacterium]
MYSAGPHCDDRSIELLLSDDTSNAGYESAARHLDRCETCRSRLTERAASRAWWDDARQFLGPQVGLGESSATRWRPDLSEPGTHPLERAAQHHTVDQLVRNVLSAPSHPEMLGRLGRYDIERLIGAGGMGVVLKAHDSELNRPVAIKVLAAHLAHVGAARERFAREGRAAAAVVHEHVVAIHNVETDGRVPLLVMQ